MKKYRTLDRELEHARTQDRFHTVERLGAKRSRTPEGFLLCEDVPIMRTGDMVYGPNETPVKPSQETGLARITRDAATLFDPVAIASFNGKPLVNNHPQDDVCPKTWRKVSIGVTLHPRQGTGDHADLLVADLLVTDDQAITDVLAGKREVSAGYDASYEQTGDGQGVQTQIIGNHVALVARGRCGPRCAIGDNLPATLNEELFKMGVKASGGRARQSIPESVIRRVLDAANKADPDPDDNDNDEDEDGEGEGKESAQHIHVHAPSARSGTTDAAIDARFTGLESMVEALLERVDMVADRFETFAETADAAEAKSKTTDAAPNAQESAAFQTSFSELLSDAEILVPGMRVPTFDAALGRKLTVDTMCQTRRRVIGHLSATKDGGDLISSVSEKFAVADADCALLATVFKAAATAKRLRTNASLTTRDGAAVVLKKGEAVAPKNIAELNDFYRQHYAAKNAQQQAALFR